MTKSHAQLDAEIAEALRSRPADKLAKHGVTTIGDLDRWIAANPRIVEHGPYARQREFLSRYQALRQIVGEDDAIEALRSLAPSRIPARTPRGNGVRPRKLRR